MQLAELRRVLDPHEWIVEYWPVKIRLANNWLTVADQLTPGRAGMSATNEARLRRADMLLSQDVPKKEIALDLGISPSHLSQLLKRRKP
jgi:CRP-like cAMP-binding protein